MKNWLSWTLLVVLTCSLPCRGQSAADQEDVADQQVLYLGCGSRVDGPGRIYQVTEEGKVLTVLDVPARPHGIAMRGDELFMATASSRIGDGAVWRIKAPGLVRRLSLDPPVGAGIDLALDPETQDLLVCDNEKHAVLRVVSSELKQTQVFFAAPLEMAQEHFPSMSVAVAGDGTVLFSAFDPKHVYRAEKIENGALPEPLLPGDAGVAADSTSARWAAVFDQELKVFDGNTLTHTAKAPEGRHFWRYQEICFTPTGDVLAVVGEVPTLDVYRFDVKTSKWTHCFLWKHEEIMSMTYGPAMEWAE